MATPRVCSLAVILHEAGFTWAGADELVGAVERINQEGLMPDDVAAALLAWRRAAVGRRLRVVRAAAENMLNHRKNRDGNLCHLQDECPVHADDDDEEASQLQLFETIDETHRRTRAIAEMAAEAVHQEAHEND